MEERKASQKFLYLVESRKKYRLTHYTVLIIIHYYTYYYYYYYYYYCIYQGSSTATGLSISV